MQLIIIRLLHILRNKCCTPEYFGFLHTVYLYKMTHSKYSQPKFMQNPHGEKNKTPAPRGTNDFI